MIRVALTSQFFLPNSINSKSNMVFRFWPGGLKGSTQHFILDCEMEDVAMAPKVRRGFTAAEKTELECQTTRVGFKQTRRRPNSTSAYPPTANIPRLPLDTRF